MPSEFGHYESKFAKTMGGPEWKSQTARLIKSESTARIEKGYKTQQIKP
jgi:hypothetical protein